MNLITAEIDPIAVDKELGPISMHNGNYPDE
jgi:hypothetical protein